MSQKIELRSKETDHYKISLMNNIKKDRVEIHIRGKSAGKHYAVHSRFNLLDNSGIFIENRPLTEEVGEFVLDNFEQRGDTESFNIFESDLDKDLVRLRQTSEMEPAMVRHVLTEEEKSYTSTGAKLDFHMPIFKKFAETGYGSIIRATMTNSQVCSSHCQYCSTILRNRKDSVSLNEAKQFVEKLYFNQAKVNRKRFSKYNDLYKQQTGTDIRLKGLILSGGGQPNLWPHFSEFVNWLKDLEIDLGLITNGFPEKISEEIYKHFKWIRISVTPEDASPHYVNGEFNQQYIPDSIKNNPDVTVGLSYVYGPWTDDNILKRIDCAISECGFDYCRMLTDCNLTRQSQLCAHHNLAERLYRLGFIDEKGQPLKKLFHQLKYHGTKEEAQALWDKGQCFLQTYNVFWDTTGHEENGYSYCYPCDSITVLAEEMTDGNVAASDRKFNSRKWGTYKNIEVEKLFMNPIKPFFDPRSICSSCLFMKNNNRVKELMKGQKILSQQKIDHVNFP